MQIWVEDSNSGYIFWKHLNKVIFNQRFKVVQHKGNKDVLKHIKTYNKNELVLLVIDLLLDEKGVREVYSKIYDIVKDKENFHILKYKCFERIFISYKNLNQFVNTNTVLSEHLREIVLKNSDAFGIININNINDKYFYKFLSDNVKSGKNGVKNSERVYSALLSKYTLNTFAEINKDAIGPCWMTDCCKRGIRTCKMTTDISNKSKLNRLIQKSDLVDSIIDLYRYTEYFIYRRYKYIKSDAKYIQLLLNLGVFKIDIIYYADKISNESFDNTWNFEKIYRRFYK